ncbi:MAG TPA: DUF2948 family protein [Dongiaceae bacterium]|jgi:hypothetical protein
MTEQPIRLRAKDAEDLGVIAAYLQDALVLRSEMRFLNAENRFVMLLNRFRWERSGGGDSAGRDASFADADAASATGHERINSGLCIDKVHSVRSRGLVGGKTGGFLSLITVGLDGPSKLNFLFSGNAALQLEIESLNLFLQDFGESWPTQWRPDHAAPEPGAGGKGAR